MRHVEAPQLRAGDGRGLFLAGGISGCRDWQREVAAALEAIDLTVLNPRRGQFWAGDEAAAREQIGWEFAHLRRASARLFWFPPETVCPIALFELGAWTRSPEPLFVGTDPAYARRFDVIEQLRLARPDVRVTDSLASLVDQVISWHRQGVPAPSGDRRMVREGCER